MVTLTLQLQPLGNGDIALRATLTQTNDAPRVVQAELHLPVDDEAEAGGDIARYGRALGAVLFQGETAALWRDGLVLAARTQDAALVCVLDLVQAASLAPINWAWLQAPFDNGWDFLAVNRRVDFGLQHHSNSQRSYPAIGPHGARALILVAPPGDGAATAPFDAAAMLADLCAVMTDYELSLLAPLDIVPPAFRTAWSGPPTLTQLEQMVAETAPAVVHVVAHGDFCPHLKCNVLHLQDSQGRDARIDSDQFQRALATRHPPRLIFLAACLSAYQGVDHLGVYPHFGQVLIKNLGTPCVVAMRDLLETSLAKALFGGFYRKLANHYGVGLALGDTLADLKDVADTNDLLVPTVYSRLAGKPLFAKDLHDPLSLEEERRGNERLRTLILNHAPGCAAFLDPLATLQSLLQVEHEHDLSLVAQTQCDDLRRRRDALCANNLDLRFESLARRKTPPTFPTTLPFPGTAAVNEVLPPKTHPDRRLLTALLAEAGPLVIQGPCEVGKTSLTRAALRDCGRPFRYVDANDPASWVRRPEDSRLVFDQLDAVLDDPTHREALQQNLAGDVDWLLVCHSRHAATFANNARVIAITAPSPEAVVATLAYQALVHGFQFDAALPAHLQRDLARCRRPLFWGQALLVALWHQRTGRKLPLAGYQRLGGLDGLIRHTDQTVQSTLGDRHQQLFRNNLLRRLTYCDAAKLPLNRLIPAPPFADIGTTLIQRLLAAGLLARTHDGDRVLIAPVHPVVTEPFRHPAEPEQARTLLRQAENWDHLGRRHQDLPDTGDWEAREQTLRQAGYIPNEIEQDFVSAARLKQAKQSSTNRRRVILLLQLTLGLGIALIGVMKLYQEAREQTRRAETEVALSQALLAENSNDQGQHANALTHATKGMQAWRRINHEQRHAQLEKETYRALVQQNDLETWSLEQAPLRHIMQADSDHLVIISERAVVLWDRRRAKVVLRYASSHVNDHWALSADGSHCATADQHGVVSEFNLRQHRPPAQHRWHSGAVTGLHYQPQTGALHSYGKDGRKITWSPPAQPVVVRGSLSLLATIPGKNSAFIADGQNGQLVRLTVAAQGFGEPQVTPWPAGARLFQPHPHLLLIAAGHSLIRVGADQTQAYPLPFPILQVATNGPNGIWLGLGHAGWLWGAQNSDEYRVVKTVNPSPWQTLAVSPAGNLVALADQTGRVVLAQTQSGFILATLNPHSSGPPIFTKSAPRVTALAFNPQGDTLWVGYASGRLARWSIPLARRPRHLQHGREKTLPIGVTDDGQRLLTQSRSKTVLWDLSIDQPIRTVTHADKPVSQAVFNRTGSTLLIGTHEGEVLWINTERGRDRRRFPRPIITATPSHPTNRLPSYAKTTVMATGPATVTALALNEKGTVGLAGYADGTTALLHPGMAEAQAKRHSEFAVTLAVAGDADTFLVAYADGGVLLVQADGQVKARLPQHQKAVRHAAFGHNPPLWVIADVDRFSFWDANGRLQDLIGNHQPVTHLRFHQNHLIAAHDNGDIQVTTLRHRQATNRAAPHSPSAPPALGSLCDKRFISHNSTEPVSALSAQGSKLLVARQGQAELWDLTRLERVALLESRETHLGAVAIRTSENLLLTIGMDSGLRRWPLDPVTPFFNATFAEEAHP